MSSLAHAQSKPLVQQAQEPSVQGIADGLPDQAFFGNAAVQSSLEEQTESSWFDGMLGPDKGVGANAGISLPLLGLLGGCADKPASPDPELEQALDDLASRSPAFAEALAKVDRSRIQLGKPGDGSANLPGGGIQIDPKRLEDPAVLYRSLAHEIGHAVQPDIQWEYDASMSRQEYIDANTKLNLENEAEALMMELAVREDLLGGPNPIDIAASGSTSKQKLALYAQYKTGQIDRDTMIAGAASLIGTEKPSKTDPGVSNYVDHYSRSHAKAWDASHPGTP